MKNHYRVVLVGDETLAAEAGQRLIERGHRVLAIITESASIAAWAEGRGIPRRTVNEVIEGEEFELLLSLANLRPLPRALLEKATLEAINFHDGPLPRYAGVHTTSWAILEGARDYGVRFHRMVEALDAGDIVAKRDFTIDEAETALSLNTRAFAEALGAFDELIDRIEEGAELCLERGSRPSRVYLKRSRPRALGVIDPAMGVDAISRLSRALDFGSYPNPLTKPKFLSEGVFFSFEHVERLKGGVRGAPGSILDARDDSVTLALSDSIVQLRGVRALMGRGRPRRGAKITELSREARRTIEEAHEASAPFEDALVRALESAEPPALHLIRAQAQSGEARVQIPLVSEGEEREFIAAFAITIARFAQESRLSFAFESEAQRESHRASFGLLMETIPLTIEVHGERSGGALIQEIERALESKIMRASISADLFQRRPGLIKPELPVAIIIGESAQTSAPLALSLKRGLKGIIGSLDYAPGSIDAGDARSLAESIDTIMAGLRAEPSVSIAALPLLSPDDRARLADGVVGERVTLGDETVIDLFEAAAHAHAAKKALIFQSESFTYEELDARADAVAAELIARRLPRNSVIGLAASRTPALVYAALGIMKAGHAYLPLDPDYPHARLMMMLEDSEAQLVLMDAVGERILGEGAALERVRIDQITPSKRKPKELAERHITDLAYVIFTSGSTGRPKGVMVEQRNLINFLRGMDDRVARDEDAGTFLALTSLSFDISALELFYCLTRGLTLVLASDEEKTLRHDASRKQLEIGLFYWGNYEGEGSDQYQLLLEGAKIADREGLSSVFIPERHFHEFGGAYPNPSVAAAALATITSRIELRAGSCVLPLHHPVRVAEEWAMVDQLSGGRVGLAFASGWQPDDFILRPENAPPKNKDALFRDLEIVRRLFRGERVEFPRPGSAPLSVRTMPRPLQDEIPIWITTAGNIETFAAAGAAGANLLTHLLGQSIDEVGEKVAHYRAALREHGHDPSKFRVTLMLHSFVARDREEARRVVEAPLKSYLRSAAGLIRNYAWAFPAFKRPAGMGEASNIDLSALSEDELEAILDYAFQRYFEESGLFGSVEDCAAQLDRVRAIDVDEVSCLVDFGIPDALALESVERLGEVLKNERASAPSEGLAAQIRRHGVRSVQGTPSTLRMLLMNDECREALGEIRHFYVGGEPLPGALVGELEALSSGRARVENMYGPTETTVWSSTGRASAEDEIAPIGDPIVNTRLMVLGEALEPIPPGMIGELYIGGEGVTRGYIGRDDLTRSVFLDDPHHPGERIYRTGDRAKLRRDGKIDFIGRVDHQVKVRGFRIELGEIERRASELTGVREAIAIVREDRPGDPQIALYLEAASESALSDATMSEVRRALAESLPAYMIPNHIVKIDRWPLTPNEKIDRKALPAPHEVSARAEEIVAPESDLERAIVELYASLFGREQLSALDHFFELGGHSLLAVEAHRRLKERLDVPITVIDIFRFPIIRELAAHLGGAEEKDAALERTRERALARRRSMQQRRAPNSA